MTLHDDGIRDKDVKQASQALQIVCVIALVALAIIDGVRDIDVPSIVYYILGGGVLGIDNVLKLLPRSDK